VDEEELCGLALEMTASQLARSVSVQARLREPHQGAARARYSSQPTGDGMVRISVVLPTEEAALVDAAVEAAARAMAESSAGTDDALPTGEPRPLPRLDRVQALVDLAANYLETRPGEPADDHTVVIVHVNAEALDVPAGTPGSMSHDVPAGTSIEAGTCFVEGHGAIEPATAERLLLRQGSRAHSWRARATC